MILTRRYIGGIRNGRDRRILYISCNSTFSIIDNLFNAIEIIVTAAFGIMGLVTMTFIF